MPASSDPTVIMRSRTTELAGWLLAVAVAVALAACGGAGEDPPPAQGVAGTSTPTPAPTPAPTPGPTPGPTPLPTPAPTPTPTPTPAPSPAPTAEATFVSTSAELANPERGMYVWAGDDFLKIAAADAQDVYARGYRLVYGLVRLDAYKSAALPAGVLDDLGTAFGVVRQAGLKVVLRFVYNYPENETQYRDAQDAPLAVLQGHLAQLKPVFQGNADVIAYLQAGFIGAWGEWHTSSNNLTGAGSMAAVRDALLDALPPTRSLQVRYPAILMDWSPQAGANARIGMHNDCFLASATDVGTYSEDAATRQGERAYVQQLTRTAPFGGETCNPVDEQGAQPRTSCDDILREGRAYGLTYLNDDYYRDVFHNTWEAQGCMAEVRRSMGYRLQLVSARHAGALAAGATTTIGFTVRNVGWARAHNPRPVVLVLRHRGSAQVHRLPIAGVDVRDWAPGADIAAGGSVTLPATMAAGAYDVYLAMPDAASRLAGDVRYALRPANADVPAGGQGWDAALGAFRLGTTVSVGSP